VSPPLPFIFSVYLYGLNLLLLPNLFSPFFHFSLSFFLFLLIFCPFLPTFDYPLLTPPSDTEPVPTIFSCTHALTYYSTKPLARQGCYFSPHYFPAPGCFGPRQKVFRPVLSLPHNTLTPKFRRRSHQHNRCAPASPLPMDTQLVTSSTWEAPGENQSPTQHVP